MNLVSSGKFSLEQNRGIIARSCTECPSQRGEVCVDNLRGGFHHRSRVDAWLADPYGLVLS